MRSPIKRKFAALVLQPLLLLLALFMLMWWLSTTGSSFFRGTIIHQGFSKEEPDFKTYSKIVADLSNKENASHQPVSVSLLINDGKDFPDLCKGPVGLPEARPVKELDLTRFGPFHFLDNYRNPCWYTNDSKRELQCLPYFYLAAFPKCGSTYLYELLCMHPDVARIKPYLTMYTKPLQRDPRKASLVVGDASQSTLFENSLWYLYPGNENCSEPRVLIVDYIRHLNPGVKIIVIVRNPTWRMFSQYKFYKVQRMGMKRTREDFHEWAKKQDWLLRFPRDQIYILRLEDLSVNIRGEMTKLFAFLELDPVSEQKMAKIVSAKEANVGTMSQKFGPILPATKSLLDDFYRPFNRRLAQLLGDDRFLWEDH
ncbi:hypothetical protein BaRGS_00006099 [Batillaria attramentaria]|uniref:Sulfotransferase domain-containing protein n=1 Tax=Batillaria attramentaria TaxID=370345 RepID=A0ABD0LU39_9CAEN